MTRARRTTALVTAEFPARYRSQGLSAETTASASKALASAIRTFVAVPVKIPSARIARKAGGVPPAATPARLRTTLSVLETAFALMVSVATGSAIATEASRALPVKSVAKGKECAV